MKKFFKTFLYISLIVTAYSDELKDRVPDEYKYDDLLVFSLSRYIHFVLDNNCYASISRGSAITIPRQFYPKILNYERVLDDLNLVPLAHDEPLQYWKDGSEYIYITRYNADGEKSNYKSRSLDVVAQCLVAVAKARLQPSGRENQLRAYLDLSFVTDAHLSAEDNPYLLKNDPGVTPVVDDKGLIDGSPGHSRKTEAEGGNEPSEAQGAIETAKKQSSLNEYRWILYALLPVAAGLMVLIFKLRRKTE